MNEPYENLANAIILRAVKDYRIAQKRLKKDPRNGKELYAKREIERFFRSDWYASLTAVAPEELIKRLKEEAVK